MLIIGLNTLRNVHHQAGSLHEVVVGLNTLRNIHHQAGDLHGLIGWLNALRDSQHRASIDKGSERGSLLCLWKADCVHTNERRDGPDRSTSVGVENRYRWRHYLRRVKCPQLVF